MAPSQNSSGSTGGRRERYPAQDDGGDSLKSLSPDDTEDDCESEEDGDDFDDSIHLSGPFRNLLVSRRFADAAVQTLWRNLVFHGHDKYQMQSLLSTLNKEDHFDFDTQALDLHNIQDMDEESGNDTEGSECQPTGDCITNTRSVSKGGINTFNKATVPPSSWTFECQGASRGWIESLNSSLKRFSGLQRLPEDQNPYAKLSTEAVRTSFSGQRRHTAAGSQMAHNRFHTLCGRFDHNTPSSENSTLARLNLNQSRWPYRRHVRRVVLNFAHPQASPQMLVSVLECIGQRCRDQIQALDLHANEKMQEAGLEKTIELERLFGSGFAKLRYLRLQGGFVDNQLLYALIKGYTTNTSRSSTLELDLNDHDNLDTKSNLHCRSPSPSPSVSTAVPCRLSQVFLGPGSVTDSAVEKLIGAAGHSLEVFTVTSCVDVGGSALASLLTKCPKLRVLGVHRSLARDRDLLEGLGIEMEDSNSQQPHHPQTADALSLFYNEGGHAEASSTKSELPRLLRKTIVAPLERLELGTVKLTSVGVAEILKGTSNTLRFLVLETQHFNEELLTEVIMGHCTRLEGLYFDCPEDLQRLQRQMQGLGFSAGRRGAHLPNWHFWFGRSGRTFYSDPDRSYRSQQFQPTHHHQHHQRSMFAGTEGMERPSSSRAGLPPKVSAWLGETTTEEWVAFGDCALWSTAASPGVSFENGGGASFMPGGLGGGFFANNQQRRRQIQPSHYAYYHAYHNPTYMATIANSYLHSGPTSGFIDPLSRGNINHPFLGEYDDVLERYHVSKQTIENVLRLLTSLRGFTVMQMDFILESQGLSEWKMLMRQEEIWLQSTGFRALQLFYLCLFLGTIYIGTFAR
ncbi:hypothetical protein BGX28_006888 [Mortierella sp. GBA30]|nr:hypothetical protein BGX28_006888 [Mortierella sp. GBA30]